VNAGFLICSKVVVDLKSDLKVRLFLLSKIENITKIENIMNKLKKLRMRLVVTAVLVVVSVNDVNAQNTYVDAMLGADMKVSTRLGKWFGIYGAGRVYVRPIPVIYVLNHYDDGRLGYDDEWSLWGPAVSATAGIEIGKKNKFVFGYRSSFGLASRDHNNAISYSVGSFLGYKREVNLNKNKFNVYAGMFGGYIRFEQNPLKENSESNEYMGYGLDLELEYERPLTKNLFLTGRVGLSQSVVGLYGNSTIPTALSINVGLHYKFRPELPNLDWNKQSKRRSVLIRDAFCPPQKRNWNNQNVIFNRP
jgi:hypothetical protein